MRCALLLASLLALAACGGKPEIYIITPGAADPMTEVTS